MTKKFSESFKLQAVEKLLNKDESSTILDISNKLGIGCSTLVRWRREVENKEVKTKSTLKPP